jgi:hypothetical protein
MIDAASSIVATLASTQTQSSLIAVRLANESQRQMADLLAESVQQLANPSHLGNLVDTTA